MIDWKNFSSYLRWRWARPVDMRKDVSLSQSTLMAAWHGKSIGVVPYLALCKAAGLDPLGFFSS